MKLALGTVQFGLNYGVTNSFGQVPKSEVKDILDYARHQGISMLDTAAAYGNSEEVLGQYDKLCNFAVVSKLPSLANSCEKIENIAKQSLHRLANHRLYALLFHNADDLLNERADEHYEKALSLKEQGICQKIGVSVYSPEQLLQICERFTIDIVQVPLNCFDQRFAQPNCRQIYNKYNIEVHTRSLFLQGTLLSDISDLPSSFTPFHAAFEKFHRVCDQLSCHPMTLALSLIQNFDFIDKAVLGVCSKLQLEQVCHHYTKAQQLDNLTSEQLSELKFHDLALINPANWPIK
ncbi:oxidoreductase [Pseudoalteromonas sp. A25]|uniref:aldo/keto reductase n=1 Tax=Pseudoalteromonas sp. A25 TaxID=116092 RepID=UPI0012610896|nr:aldo/keto reductase [Pseudoalteromonas sp. A25]BBN81098.1 oxidoreductase [Pseudoalteromonas sp. A25]